MVIFCAVRDKYSAIFNYKVLQKRPARTVYNGIVYTKNILKDVIALHHRCSRRIGRFREISAFPSMANF